MHVKFFLLISPKRHEPFFQTWWGGTLGITRVSRLQPKVASKVRYWSITFHCTSKRRHYTHWENFTHMIKMCSAPKIWACHGHDIKDKVIKGKMCIAMPKVVSRTPPNGWTDSLEARWKSIQSDKLCLGDPGSKSQSSKVKKVLYVLGSLVMYMSRQLLLYWMTGAGDEMCNYVDCPLVLNLFIELNTLYHWRHKQYSQLWLGIFRNVCIWND